MNIKPVIITALYDIGRDNWEKFTMSYDTYLHWMKNTLSINCSMVIYTEKKFEQKIKEFRREVDSGFEKTIIVVEDLTDISCYKKYNDILFRTMYSDEFINDSRWNNVPEMNMPLYNIVMFNKIDWLMDAYNKKYFDGNYYLWLDAGGIREELEKNIEWPSIDKIKQIGEKIVFFSHDADFTINQYKSHAISQIRKIQGTAFFVPASLINKLYEEFHRSIQLCLNDNFIGSDEKILDITYTNNKNICHLIKCTWREYYNIFRN